MVSVLGSCEGEDGGREEHGFVIGVCDQETDALVLDGRLGLVRCEHVNARHHDGEACKDVKNVHVGGGFRNDNATRLRLQRTVFLKDGSSGRIVGGRITVAAQRLL